MRIEGPNAFTNFLPQESYTTKQGDTLNSVAQQFQVSLQNLAELNKLSINSALTPGTQLLLPLQQLIQSAPIQAAQLAGLDQLEPQSGGEVLGVTRQPLIGAVTNPLDLTHLKQTEQRACGTTALAMILNFFGANTTPGDIDNEIRRMNVGVAPERIIDYARDQGYNAEQYNNGSWEELKGFLDRGIPCMCQIDPDSPDNFNTHYVDVVGYRTNEKGEEIVIVQDPSKNTGPTEMTKDDFMKKWGNLNIENVENGYNNFFIAIAPAGTTLPPSRVDENAAASALDTGKSDLTNGLDRMFSPDNFGDPFQGFFESLGGVFGLVGGGVGFGIWKAGDWLNDLVEGIPVLENLVQPFGDIFEGVGEGVADIFNAVDNVAKDVGDMFGSLFEGDFGGAAQSAVDVVGDAVGGVVDAVGDVAGGVVDAVGDLFSGW